MRYIQFCVLFFFLLVQTAEATIWDYPSRVSQGRAFVVSFEDEQSFNGILRWNEKEVFFVSEKVKKETGTSYQAKVMLGMPIDARQNFNLTAEVLTQKEEFIDFEAEVQPLFVQWKEHNLKVASKYVQPPQEVLTQIKANRVKARQALDTIGIAPHWELPFERPTNGNISGSFGARRVFNGEPRAPHMGTDMRGAIGNDIRAVSDGVVVIAEPMYYAGNVVYIDHGQGVLSMYGHLSAFNVKAGDTVKKGQVIGKVGATGRVTGPHLHMSVYIQGVAVDVVPLYTEPFELIGGPTREDPRPK